MIIIFSEEQFLTLRNTSIHNFQCKISIYSTLTNALRAHISISIPS